MRFAFAFLCLIVLVKGEPEVPEAEWEIMENGGLRAKVPNIEGLSEVDLHFNINKPLSGVSAGDYNVIIRNAGTDGIWIHEAPEIQVKDGDVVNYWILVIVNGGGYQKLDLSFTLHSGGTTTTTSTTTTQTTTEPTTTTSTTTTTMTTTTDLGLPEVQFELMEPEGLKIWLEDSQDHEIMFFGFHMNINEPLNGVDFGDFNYVVDHVDENGNWSIEETGVSLNDSDIVYFWYYIAMDSQGFQITDQMWSPGGPLTTTTPGTTTEHVPDIISVTESSEGNF